MSPSSRSSSEPSRLHRRPFYVQQARKLCIGIVRFFASYSFNETGFLLVLSLFIGLGGSLGAVGFRWLIDTFKQIFLVQPQACSGIRTSFP